MTNPDLTQKVGDYYASWMDQDAIEAEGLAPLAPELARIAAITDTKSLSAYLGSTLNTETDGLVANSDHIFGLWVAQGFDDADHNLPHLLQGGLGLPDREAYLNDAPKTVELRQQYTRHVAAVLGMAGVAHSAQAIPKPEGVLGMADATGSEPARARAEGVLALEIAIARSHAPDSDAADVFKQNNPWKRADFAAKAPGMDWEAYFAAAGMPNQQDFIVWQPSAITGTSALVAGESFERWKDYVTFHLIEHYAGVLPKAVRVEDGALAGGYSSLGSGSASDPDREAAAIAATNGALGQAVGQLYTQRYFPPRAKGEAQAMVRNIIAAYRQRISNLSWMTPETKKKALAKLEGLTVGVGYPDHWIDYSSLEVVRGDAFGNLRRAEQFQRALNLAQLKQPADPNDPAQWRIDAQQVGAIIMFSPNAEFFSAAILQPPYFDGSAMGDGASNYGSAGVGIAHEISHSFDELGNIYDDRGRLVRWWTEQDTAQYHAAAAKLASQMDHYCPFTDACVNGKQVLNESVADQAGLLVAHDAYLLALKQHGKPDSVIGGLTGEQRFFLAFAQRWRRAQDDAALRRQIASDTHLPPAFRSNAVRNVDAWYKAFQVGPGSKLYLKLEQRVAVW